MTEEQIFLTKTVRKVENMRSQAEDCLLQIVGLTALGANVADIQAAALRLQRQLVLELGGMVLQLRMAAAEGLELADKVFSPVAGYDELPEEQAKAFRESKREQEKESRAKAQQAARGGGGRSQSRWISGQGSLRLQAVHLSAAVWAADDCSNAKLGGTARICGSAASLAGSSAACGTGL